MQLKTPSIRRHSREQARAHAPASVESARDKRTHKGLDADVMFFVDHAISVAVNSVARNQAQSARLLMTGKSGANLHVSVATTGNQNEDCRYVAYNNDMCLFVGSSPSLYVVNQTARDLEHAIFIYISERLSGEQSVSATIFRESGSVFDLPVLEGCSEYGPLSLRPRQTTEMDV